MMPQRRLVQQPVKKPTVVMRMLALGNTVDATDEYCKIGESTALESLKSFCVAVRAIFGLEYLRQRTKHDIVKANDV
jgi:hypothetical protein